MADDSKTNLLASKNINLNKSGKPVHLEHRGFWKKYQCGKKNIKIAAKLTDRSVVFSDTEGSWL